MSASATRTYLEIRTPGAIRPPDPMTDALLVAREARCSVALYRRLYADIGAAYHWVDRAAWSDEDIREHLALPEVAIWLGRIDGETAGFFELRGWGDGSCEIAYFGLLPAFVGRGLGGTLLTSALRCAWDTGPTRVWLHTSSLDHPAALPNYLARGLTVTHAETYDPDPPVADGD